MALICTSTHTCTVFPSNNGTYVFVAQPELAKSIKDLIFKFSSFWYIFLKIYIKIYALQAKHDACYMLRNL